MTTIDRFEGENEFLSNLFPCEIEFEGKVYPSSEHAFQATRTLDEVEREWIRAAKSGRSAKTVGKSVTVQRDWDFKRTAWMRTVLDIKFSNPELRAKLRATGDATLVEGGDKFWGVSGGSGENRLGKILMQIRETLS